MTYDDDGSSKVQSTRIMSRLKKETREYHSTLESFPFFKALIEHRLPLACYVGQLKALAVIHGLLENEMAASDDKHVLSIWDERMRKVPLLQEDLQFFETRVISDTTVPIEAALALTQDIRRKRSEHSVTLLGYLYVLEGSTLGNRVHLIDISAAFYLNAPDGCRYYSSYGDQVRANWDRFSKKMNAVLTAPAIQSVVIEAAHEAFSGLEVLYTALYPLDESTKDFRAARINPEAGNHPIPENEPEIKAALRASDRAWAEFPYYEHRYGERGKRFSDSDTCWLATLTALDQESLQRQIDWLCRVLAVRGMPSLLMEHILRFLHEELTAVAPADEAIYEKLLISADILRKAREKRLPHPKLDALASEFEAAVGSEMAEMYKNTGKLLGSAVADEKNGIKGAVAGLQKWLTDVDRFTNEWISAVNETIKKAD